MRGTRRLATVATVGAAATLVGLTAGTLLAPPAAAATVGPIATAWYDASRADSSAPAAPMPDVAPDQLLVNGAAAGGTPAGPAPAPPGGLPVAPPGGVPAPTDGSGSVPTAAAALAFELPSGSSAVGLVLKAAQALPSGTPAPLACLVTAPFAAGAQQPFPVPAHDCSTSSLGVVDGSTVRFSDIGRLQRGSRLAVVVLPAAAGRLVLAAPGADALQLADLTSVPVVIGSGTGAVSPRVSATPTRAAPRATPKPTGTARPSTPAPARGAPPPPPAPGVPAPGAPAAGLPAVGLPAGGLPAGGLPAAGLPAAALPAGPDTTLAGGAPSAPLAPGLPAAGPGGVRPAASSAAARLDDTGAKVAAGIGLLVLGLAALLILGRGRLQAAALAPLLARASGGRLVAATAADGPPSTSPAAGLGRFRGERTGPVPRL